MVLKLVQFRYYGKNNLNQNNYPQIDINQEELEYDFSLYANKQKITIHTIPGTNIYLNHLNNRTSWNNGAPIVIGQSGILEIAIQKNLTDDEDEETYYINNALNLSSIKLDKNSKKIIDNFNNGYFIITIFYYDDK